MSRPKVLAGILLLALLAACAMPIAEEAVMLEPEPVMAEPVSAEPLDRAEPCDPNAPDDGIGGTGCTPELD